MRNFQLKLIVLHLLFVGIVSGQVRPTESLADVVTMVICDGCALQVGRQCIQMHIGGNGEVHRYAAARAKADIKSSEVTQTSDVAALPTLSSFLPPAIAVNTLTPGGYKNGSPWIQIGSQNTYPADPASVSCANNIYLVVVLDRQTLQEKTAAPESSPQCISNGAALKTYLASLSAGDLVIVSSNAFFNSDAGTGSGQLDTSAIGGSVYNCVGGTSCASVPANTVTSPDVPLGYIAIGVGGAASGSAYEYYYQANDPWRRKMPCKSR
jgi:hypothetical protein